MKDFLILSIQYTLGGLGLIVLAYLLTRSVSYAYFRSRLEYWRTFIREMRRR